MNVFMLIAVLVLAANTAFANLKYHPVSFQLSTDKASYYEGEKITFLITITNNDPVNTHPVLLPHTQNVGQKLFYLEVYDKANNTMLLRYSEDKELKMMIHDTGTVQIRYLKPLEQVVVPIYLNDSENYYSYHTQNASHHSFGVPLFAGSYKVRVIYNAPGVALGDSIYNYYNDTETELPVNGKLAMPGSGDMSHLHPLIITRSADTVVSIERQKFYIKTDGHRYYYFTEPVTEITTDLRCVHITSLPADSSSLPSGEYFYSQFPDRFNEYIVRFDDGDILEYRKFRNECPDYLYTERYNAFKHKTQVEMQLLDKRFYSVTYNQPSGTIHQQSYCSQDGTLCIVTTYVYTEKGELKRKETHQTQPCVEIELEGGVKKSVKRVEILGGQE